MAPELATLKDAYENLVLHFAVRASDVAVLLSYAPPCAVYARNRSGRTPLHLCVSGGRIQAVRALLDRAPEVAAMTDVNSMAPMHTLDWVNGGRGGLAQDLARMLVSYHPASAGVEMGNKSAAALLAC